VTFVIVFLSIVAVMVLFNARGGGKGAERKPGDRGLNMSMSRYLRISKHAREAIDRRSGKMPPPSAGDGDAIDDYDPSSIYAPGGLLETDPAMALTLHGTPADAERLIDQGVDLEALGYSPPPPDDQRPWGS